MKRAETVKNADSKVNATQKLTMTRVPLEASVFDRVLRHEDLRQKRITKQLLKLDSSQTGTTQPVEFALQKKERSVSVCPECQTNNGQCFQLVGLCDRYFSTNRQEPTPFDGAHVEPRRRDEEAKKHRNTNSKKQRYRGKRGTEVHKQNHVSSLWDSSPFSKL